MNKLKMKPLVQNTSFYKIICCLVKTLSAAIQPISIIGILWKFSPYNKLRMSGKLHVSCLRKYLHNKKNFFVIVNWVWYYYICYLTSRLQCPVTYVVRFLIYGWLLTGPIAKYTNISVHNVCTDDLADSRAFAGITMIYQQVKKRLPYFRMNK